MKSRHVTIPIFLPDIACPFACVFCNQKNISGILKLPEPHEVKAIIEKHLTTIDKNNTLIELGFFGGSFTALPIQIQENYLKQAITYTDKSVIQGIRLSTRPDFITPEILNLLKTYGVTTIELGAQSFDNEVLKQSGRGHTAEQITEASAMIINAGFRLGLQMMTGLPGDSPEKTIYTAECIAASGAAETRIYPTLVIQNTALEHLYRQGKYIPLSLNEAVLRCAEIFRIVENHNITVLRMGLHPSEGLLNKTSLVAGPFHVSFKELVLTELWKQELMKIEPNPMYKKLSLTVASPQIKHAIGYDSTNKRMLETFFQRVEFVASNELNHRAFYVHYS